MRRRVAVVVVAVFGSLLSAQPAAADSTVISYSGLPDGLAVIQQACGSEDVSPAGYSRTTDLADDPLFNASLWVDVDPGYRGGVRVSGDSLDELGSFRVPIRYAATRVSSAMHLTSTVDVVVGAATWRLTRLFLTFSHGWVSNDYGSADYSWTEVGSAGTGQGSLQDFVSSIGDGAFTATVWADECIGSGGGVPFGVDAVAYGAQGSVVTADFEVAPSPTIMTLFADAWTPSPVARRAIGVGLMESSQPNRDVTDAIVTLSVRRIDRPGFRVVAHATTDENGMAVVHVPLPRSSVVRWSFAGNERYLPTQRTMRLATAPRVTIQASKRLLVHGQRLTVSGRTAPAKPGSAVTLWRESAQHPVRLAHSHVRGDGTYALHRTLRRHGVWRVYTTVAKSASNTSGLSRTLKVRVR